LAAKNDHFGEAMNMIFGGGECGNAGRHPIFGHTQTRTKTLGIGEYSMNQVYKENTQRHLVWVPFSFIQIKFKDQLMKLNFISSEQAGGR